MLEVLELVVLVLLEVVVLVPHSIRVEAVSRRDTPQAKLHADATRINSHMHFNLQILS